MGEDARQIQEKVETEPTGAGAGLNGNGIKFVQPALQPARAPTAAVTPVRKLPLPLAPRVSVVNTLWQSVTPWQEEAGETFTSHIKGWPTRTLDTFKGNISGKVQSQEKLKASFESYNKSSVWEKILFDQPVFFNKETGQYVQVLTGYAPAVSGPAKGIIQSGSKLVRVLGPDDVKMSTKTFNAFVKARVSNPSLTPEAFKVTQTAKVDWKALSTAVRKGNIKSQKDVVKMSKAKRPVEVKPKLTRTEASKARIAERRQDRLLGNKVQAEVKVKPITINKAAFSGIVSGNVAVQIAKWQRMSAAQAAASIKASPSAAGAFVADPQGMVDILVEMEPETAIDLINATAATVRTLPLTEQEQATAVQQMVETATKVITDTATDTATKSQTKGDTATQTQQKVATSVKTQTQNLTSTQVKTQVQQKESTITKQAVKTAKTGRPAKVVKPPAKPVKTTVPPPVRIPSAKQERANRRRVKDAEGAIAFRTGELRGKDVWRVIMWPYRQRDMVTVLGRTPQGAVAVRGPESARRTAIKIGRAPSKKLQIDMGFQDITVTPLGETKIKLDFQADPKLETTLPLTISGTGKSFPLEDRKRK